MCCVSDFPESIVLGIDNFLTTHKQSWAVKLLDSMANNAGNFSILLLLGAFSFFYFHRRHMLHRTSNVYRGRVIGSILLWGVLSLMVAFCFFLKGSIITSSASSVTGEIVFLRKSDFFVYSEYFITWGYFLLAIAACNCGLTVAYAQYSKNEHYKGIGISILVFIVASYTLVGIISNIEGFDLRKIIGDFVLEVLHKSNIGLDLEHSDGNANKSTFYGIFHILSEPNSQELSDGGSKETIKLFDFIFYFSVFYLYSRYFLELYFDREENEIEKKSQTINESSIKKFLNGILISLNIVLAMVLVGANFVGISIFSGLLGAGLSVAFRDLLHNFAAGIILGLDRAILKGDFIKTNSGVSGEVLSTNLRFTILRDRNNVEYIIPNAMLVNSDFENYSRSDERVRLVQKFSISVDADISRVIDKVENHILTCSSRLLRSHNYIPRVFYLGVDHLGHHLEIRFWINDPQIGIANIKSDVMLHISRLLGDENKTGSKKSKYVLAEPPKFELRNTN